MLASIICVSVKVASRLVSKAARTRSMGTSASDPDWPTAALLTRTSIGRPAARSRSELSVISSLKASIPGVHSDFHDVAWSSVRRHQEELARRYPEGARLHFQSHQHE